MERDKARELPELPDLAPLVAPAWWPSELATLGVTLTDAQSEKLGSYLARLLAMNERMNLTAITNPDDAWRRHALDALSLVPFLAPVPAGGRLIDVGSGGGIPGIPLAIARPDLAITLLEATQKKARFLETTVAALGLSHVTVVASRAEQAAGTAMARTFDAVSARAVARLSALLPWTAPFAKVGGLLLLIKGQQAEQELAEAKRELARYKCSHERTVPTATGRIVALRRA